jgi:2-dehydropantoate 2-reductase
VRSYAILGAGGVGGLVGGALARSGAPVTLVATERTAAAVAAAGLRVSSVRLGDFEVRPPAVTRLTDPVDVLVVAVKATSLDAALDRVAAEPAIVVPLLNGLDHLARLRARFGPRVPAATIRVESTRTEPGVVVHTSPFLSVDVAAEDPTLAARLEALVAELRAAGIPAERRDSEAAVMWSKLSRLVALATVTSAAGLPMGGVRADPRWRAALEGVAREASAVATAEGAPTDPEAKLEELAAVHDDFRSSMQRDIAARHEPELDAIAGAVIRAGARHGVRCPTIQWLAEQVARRAAGAWPKTRT